MEGSQRRQGPSESDLQPGRYQAARTVLKPPVDGSLPALLPFDLGGGPNRAGGRTPGQDKPSFAALSQTSRASSIAGRPKERLCLALRLDTEGTEAVKGGCTLSIPIPVKWLGGHDATFHYIEKHLDLQNHVLCLSLFLSSGSGYPL